MILTSIIDIYNVNLYQTTNLLNAPQNLHVKLLAGRKRYKFLYSGIRYLKKNAGPSAFQLQKTRPMLKSDNI